MTVTELITASLQDLNLVPGGGGVAAPDDLLLAYSRLNDWVDDLKNDGLAVYAITRTTWTLVSGTASYSIGTGGTINVDRPVSPQAITNIGFQDTTLTVPYEAPLGPVLTEDAYAAIPFKTLQSAYPNAFYYAPTYPLGAIKPFPIPTASSLLGVIYTQAPISEFTSLTQTIALPPGFRRFIRNALTAEIAPAFERPVPPTVLQALDDARAKLKRQNERLMDIGFDPALTPGLGASDIYSGN